MATKTRKTSKKVNSLKTKSLSARKARGVKGGSVPFSKFKLPPRALTTE